MDKILNSNYQSQYYAFRPTPHGSLTKSPGKSHVGSTVHWPRRNVAFFLLLAVALVIAPAATRAGDIAIGVSVRIGPPPIPVYVQPVCPAPGYIWTPGYWAYDPVGGYFWVPGTWVMAPRPGFLWTPGYWG